MARDPFDDTPREMTAAERKANLPLDEPRYWEKVALAEPITVERVAELEHCLSVVRQHRNWLAYTQERNGHALHAVGAE